MDTAREHVVGAQVSPTRQAGRRNQLANVYTDAFIDNANYNKDDSADRREIKITIIKNRKPAKSSTAKSLTPRLSSSLPYARPKLPSKAQFGHKFLNKRNNELEDIKRNMDLLKSLLVRS